MEECVCFINVDYTPLHMNVKYFSRNKDEKRILSPEVIDRMFVKKEKLETPHTCDLLSAMIAYEKLSVGYSHYSSDFYDEDDEPLAFVKGGIIEIDGDLSKWKLIGHKNSFMELARKEVREQFISYVNYYYDYAYIDFKIEEDGDYYLFTFSCDNKDKYRDRSKRDVRPSVDLTIPYD
ncbi:MAG: hypothetical protein ACRC5M_04375 [Anaeroplasmataceae bacterium]